MAPAKAKGQKMSMVEFLGVDKPSGDFSWADESEEAGMEQPNVPAERRERPSYGMGYGNGGFDREARGGGGFESRGYETRGGYAVREPLDLPTEPPFTAHIGNLSFEATAADVTDLFADCGVTNVRIVEDRQTNTPKGFGYIEFETVAGLQKALDLSGTNLMGRTIRTSVADPPKEGTRADPREMDWTRRGPLPPAPSERRVPDRSSFGRNMDAASDAGSERGGRRSNFESDGKFRDFGNWERKGPLSPPAGAGFREGGRPRNNDGAAPAWGEGRSQDGSRPPRPDRPERTPTAADMDNQWRTKMRPDAAPKEPTSPVAPAARPRLNLQKRTVSEAVSTPAADAGDSKASPFGAARPIDTATREREVEERRQLAIRQKKESDDKAKAEKAEKAEKQKKEPKVGTDSNKDAIEPPKGGGNFEILRRAGEDETNTSADKETEETAVPAAAAEETPKEAATNGSWRTAEAPAADNDGWSTVDTTKKRGRRGGRF
ncbi:uncharacterized protein N7473_004825 [Penicillium subrubescens]|uniref:RRM domain-containing protein n=1 Tax=Penicillium subrubescens TaxID=1316194 RepID=A0A1Q5UF19_9EURO|nr:uncharacterized protein N7473_004825 [Penicillium subrubescens]KAJ5900755.1 hypothetical protein N7473_004825 [Penicillium subrubescens]OKP11066.1 hypothetical protein PENSUB_3502 [Penicillium subrubescens]